MADDTVLYSADHVLEYPRSLAPVFFAGFFESSAGTLGVPARQPRRRQRRQRLRHESASRQIPLFHVCSLSLMQFPTPQHGPWTDCGCCIPRRSALQGSRSGKPQARSGSEDRPGIAVPSLALGLVKESPRLRFGLVKESPRWRFGLVKESPRLRFGLVWPPLSAALHQIAEPLAELLRRHARPRRQALPAGRRPRNRASPGGSCSAGRTDSLRR